MYRAFFASAFQTRLAYRSQVWALLLYGFVTVFAKIAIWVALYAQVGTATVGGITRSDMITYAILGGVVLNWDYTRFIRTFGRQIQSGDVSVFLLKPVRYPLMLLAGACGNLAFELLAVQLPVTIVASLFYGLTPPHPPLREGWRSCSGELASSFSSCCRPSPRSSPSGC